MAHCPLKLQSWWDCGPSALWLASPASSPGSWAPCKEPLIIQFYDEQFHIRKAKNEKGAKLHLTHNQRFTSTNLADFIQTLAILHPPDVAYPDLGHDVWRAGAVICGQRGRWRRGRWGGAWTRGWRGVVLWRLKGRWRKEVEEKMNKKCSITS